MAGGWSFTEVDPSKLPGTVIAVNDAAKHLPRWSAAVSMDRRWTENRWELLEQCGRQAFLRDKNRRREWPDRDWATWCKMDEKTVIFGSTHESMSGDNSGTVALNVAFIARPRELYLFGFDMCRGPRGESHWYPMYEWRDDKPKGTSIKTLEHWAREMQIVNWQMKRSGISVVNVSTRSRIDAFRRVAPRALGIGR